MNEMPPLPVVEQDTLKSPVTPEATDTLKTPSPEGMSEERMSIIMDAEEALRASGNEKVNLSIFREVAMKVIDAVEVNPAITIEQVKALCPEDPDMAYDIYNFLVGNEPPQPPTPEAAAMALPEELETVAGQPANDNAEAEEDEDPSMRIAA